MTKLRNGGTLVMAIVFAAVMFYYSFCQPFIPGTVCEAIPTAASDVFKTDSLDQLLNSPVCAQIDKSFGGATSLRELTQSNRWIKLAASSEIAVANIPLRSASGGSIWAAASWVGWRSPWLRWRLEHSRCDNLHQFGRHGVWPVWEFKSPDLAREKRLTLALTDNLLLICLSERPTDIALLLDAYDKRIPALQP